MIEIGRLCIKTAGRDSGLKCIIIDILDNKFVLIDGETRRKKCNILHLEPLKEVIKIKKNASHEEVSKALKELNITARETKPKPKTERPRKKKKIPGQPKVQKEEKKKLRDVFGLKKKKEEKVKVKEKKEESLEDKAGLVEEEKGSRKKEDNKGKKKEAKKNSKSSKE